MLAAWLRWYCRNTVGDAAFSFDARGHEILWGCVVGMLGFTLVIPIPWMVAWLTKWFLSQISMEHGTGIETRALEPQVPHIEQPGQESQSPEQAS